MSAAILDLGTYRAEIARRAQQRLSGQPVGYVLNDMHRDAIQEASRTFTRAKRAAERYGDRKGLAEMNAAMIRLTDLHRQHPLEAILLHLRALNILRNRLVARVRMGKAS